SQDISRKPGVYIFRNNFGDVIYVGKAKNLRKRVSTYIRPSGHKKKDPKLRSLIKSIADIETIEVRNEQEALILEAKLIKKYYPRYNIDLRDDKRFLLIKLDLKAPYPRIITTRLKKDDGFSYYGPFPQVSALKETVRFLNDYYSLRRCSTRIPGNKDREHCLDSIVRNCSAPCENKITQKEYHVKVNQLCELFAGKNKQVIEHLEGRMHKAAEKKLFEEAARMRDMLENIKFISVQINRSFARARIVRDNKPDKAIAELKEYLKLENKPNKIECFDNSNLSGQMAVAAMVCFKKGRPSNKDYRHYNIREVKGIDDFATMQEVIGRRYSRILREGRELPDLILVDGGKGQLSSAIKALEKLNIKIKKYLPKDSFEKSLVSDIKKSEKMIAIAGLAKKHEEIFLPGLSKSIRLQRNSYALRLLQHIRDEAHRFAINFHRKYRQKQISNSILDEIPGIGEKRKKILLKEFGSVNKLKKMSVEEILIRAPGMGEIFARKIFEHLNPV
ncbi:MAG: excinuclease ABC subunit UvrC, partial [Verrucomicrobiota bacterium]|nr:excinuclease ABC subunit UvrC [Verrucomicrobiota bacterium]